MTIKFWPWNLALQRSSIFAPQDILLSAWSSLFDGNHTIFSTWFRIRFKVFHHSAKNYLLSFENNFRRKHSSYIFFRLFFLSYNSEKNVSSYQADFPFNSEEKISRIHPSYDFFRKFFLVVPAVWIGVWHCTYWDQSQHFVFVVWGKKNCIFFLK